jgi:Ca2+-binding RTX toxin-like protein
LGNSGGNFLDGRGGADLMAGFGGNDVYVVDNAADFPFEALGEGVDTVYALTSYTLGAGTEIEILSVTDHSLTTAINLTGNEYNNAVLGNGGANVINGGLGTDYLYGFGGADSFVFNTALGGGNADVIYGYDGIGTDGDDVILLDDAVFTGMALGALDPNAFVAGTAALDANDRIIYDPTTGALYFDADGSGGGAQVLFAVLDSSPALTAGDFTVI